MNDLIQKRLKVLLVQNSELLRAGIKSWLSKQNDIALIGEMDEPANAFVFLQNPVQNPDLILFDIQFAEISYRADFKQLIAKYPTVKMIAILDEIAVAKVLNAFNLGFEGCLLQSTAEEEFIFGLRQVAKDNTFICMELNMELWKRVKWNPGIFSLQEPVDIHFSERELEILNLVASGNTNQEIADQLFVSKRTIEGYRLQLLHKAKVKNTAALVKFCLLNGILPIN